MDGGARAVSSPSPGRRVSILLAAGMVIVAVLAAVASFALSFDEAKEFQDDALQQIAAMATSRTDDDAQSRITVLRVPREPVPAWLPHDLPAGLHTVDGPQGQSMRVFVADDTSQGRVIVFQDMSEIDDVAMGSALQTFIPALLMIPLVAWLTLRVLRSERRRVQAQRRFIADAAHELRSPLTALSIQAENVDSAPTPEAAQARLAALRDGIQRAQRVADQMLAMARVHSTAQALEPVDVAGLVREVIADASHLARQRGVDLGLEEDARPLVKGSRDALRLIVKNAVDNAIRYTGGGGTVTVCVRDQAADALVEIHDDGPGMPPELASRAFEPFRRGITSEQGAGLGLAIARDAAEKMGGSVTLRGGAEGRGLVFVYRQRAMERPRTMAAST
jgi:two-component system OmpR family sensor kinase